MDFEPEALKTFLAWIPCMKEGHAKWLDYYPFQARITTGFDDSKDNVMLVDVGGSSGNEIMLLKKHFPALPGRFILQDLPSVLSSLPADHGSRNGFEMVPYDFHTPQPVIGARVYYLRFILHDHNTPAALSILARVRAAMRPGYSRLLVNEQVLPDDNLDARPYAAHMDLTMLANFGALERKAKQWRELFSEAGMEVLGIWRPEEEQGEDVRLGHYGGIIECQVAD